MAHYVMLANFTEQGIKNVKNSPNRAEQVRKEFEAVGGKLVSVFWTLGQYDLVATIEAPNDETLTKMMLQVGIAGNVRTTTLKAFDESEFRAIVDKL